jgi:hypothetical protein
LKRSGCSNWSNALRSVFKSVMAISYIEEPIVNHLMPTRIAVKRCCCALMA